MHSLAAIFMELQFTRCPTCHGMKTIALSNGQEIPCTKCHGKGVVRLDV